MKSEIMERKEFNREEIKAIAPMEKFAVLAGVSPEGYPHISLINSVMAEKSDQMTIGEFTGGLIKQYMETNRKTSFCIQTTGDMKMYRGKALWTHKKREGDELEAYKNTPVHRYNAYFPIHTVHFMDLIALMSPVKLSVAATGLSAVVTKMAKGTVRTKGKKSVLNHYSLEIFNGLAGLKYLSYIGEDGFPVIIPILQCQAVDSGRLAFSAGQFRHELESIPHGVRVAVFAANMSFESVLIRGTYNGMKHKGLIRMGTIDIDWVYNSMPPNTGQIYPKVELKKVENF
jgi:hypothetical protein